MDYAVTRSHKGDPQRILSTIRDQLIQRNFRIERQFENGLAFHGPGMHSSRQDALLGMTHVEVHVTSNEVSLQADLGGVRFLKWFVTLFPPGLGLGLFVLFLFVLPNRGAAFAPLLATAPWLVLGPVMAWLFKKRTTSAIETMLDNAIIIEEMNGGGA
jgi:hypothetical protein